MVERVVYRSATHKLNLIESSPVVFNSPALEAAVGKANVSSPPAQMVSEDLAFYRQKISGFYFFSSINNPEKGITAMWHPLYFDLADEAIRVGIMVIANVVLQYLRREIFGGRAAPYTTACPCELDSRADIAPHRRPCDDETVDSSKA